MTRINLVDVKTLSDQHLWAEYRELPRLGSYANTAAISKYDIPEEYVLGAGHMKFFLNKGTWLEQRHAEIKAELKRRGKNFTELPAFKMPRKFGDIPDWEPSQVEVRRSLMRITERLIAKPTFYTWTNCGETHADKTA